MAHFNYVISKLYYIYMLNITSKSNNNVNRRYVTKWKIKLEKWKVPKNITLNFIILDDVRLRLC